MSDKKILSSEDGLDNQNNRIDNKARSEKVLSSEEKHIETEGILAGEVKDEHLGKQVHTLEQIRGITIYDRIRNSTLKGGLNTLPANFDDSDGDWKIIKSDNIFERLYLDYKEYRKIKPSMVENNYQILKMFWEDKISAMQTGANKFKFIKKYAGDEGSERTILNYPKRIKEAYDKLTKVNGIEINYKLIEEERIGAARKLLEEDLLIVLEKGTLEPGEEKLIKNKARKDTRLTEEEINELIEEYLEKTGSIRGEGGEGITEERERHFLHNIKKLLKDKYLSEEEEKELADDAPVFNIPPATYEKLIIQALREVDESEREKTFEQDKKAFKEYYFSLLKNYGLTTDEQLPDEAQDKLSERDMSETDFFPLSQKTRQLCIEEETASYTERHAEEKSRFYEEALEKLDRYDGHTDVKERLFSDESFELLLPKVRSEQIDAAIENITEKQSEGYLDATKKLFQENMWHVSDELTERFLIAVHNLHGYENVRSDWLARDSRVALFEKGERWANLQYKNEIKVFKANVVQELKKFIYGVPINVQEKMENDKSLYLDKKERREFLIKIEKQHRKNAEKKFYDLVNKALVFNTLVPDVEEKLLKTGKNELVLTPEKNKMSYEVKTAQDIINEKREAFDRVLGNQVLDLFDSRKLDDSLIKEYNLEHSAYITLPEIEDFVSKYKPSDKTERKTVLNEFKRQAKQAELHIVSRDGSDEFDDVLVGAMEKKSSKYKYSLKKWLTNSFTSDIVKVGAAHGVREDDVKTKLEQLKLQYPGWTRPKWGVFFKYFFFISAFFTLFRFLVSNTGYPNWLMMWKDIKRYQLSELFETIDISIIESQVRSNEYWLAAYIGFAFIFILYRIFRPKKKRR